MSFDTAKIRRFLVSFQTFSHFFFQKLWTKNPFMDKPKKSPRFLSIRPNFGPQNMPNYSHSPRLFQAYRHQVFVSHIPLPTKIGEFGHQIRRFWSPNSPILVSKPRRFTKPPFYFVQRINIFVSLREGEQVMFIYLVLTFLRILDWDC